MNIIYKTRATSVGGRSGHVELDDGTLGFDMTMPGTGLEGVNPDRLFALGYAACFDSSLAAVAKQHHSSMQHSKTTVEVGLGHPDGQSGYALDIDIYVEMSGVTPGQASELVEMAHQVCPYSKATRNNVEVRLHSIAK